MITSTNPFDNDEIKKQILGNSDEVEILDDGSDTLDLRNVISSAPTLPKSAKNVIMDASALARNEKEKSAQEMNLALSEIFTKYNQEYGLDLNLNLGSLSETLINVSSPEKRKVLELYVSEVFKSVKPILLLHMLQRLVILMDYVLKPENLMNTNQLSLPDMFMIVEKIQQWIVSLTDIIDSEAVVSDSEQVLKKLAEEQQNEDLSSEESKKAVEEFMNLFKKDSGIN